MFKQILTFATYVVLEALRTRFFIVIGLLLIMGIGLTLFLGQIAITETQATQSSLLAAFLRLATVYAISLFVISSIVHEFNDNSIYLWLSFPIQRSTYFLGKLGGFTLVATLIASLAGLILLQYASYQSVLLWTISLWCELLIMVTLSLLCVFTFPYTIQAFSVVVGFYLLARSIGAMQLMTQGILMNHSTAWIDKFIKGFIQLLAMLLPNFEYFTQSSWLVYQSGQINDLVAIVVQTAIYVLLLSAMSLFDLYRKNL